MSGYGGQPPGWNDPYGQQQPGWNDPYGTPNRQTQPNWDPYGQYAPQGQNPYGYGPPGVYGPQASHGAAVGALIANIIATLFCCSILGIAGIVTSAMAMGRTQTNPESARKLTTWSWVIFGVGLVLGIVLIILYVVLVVNSDPDSLDNGSGV
jgi:hypothetical protein